MKASDYRTEFSAYRTARERAAYEFYSGRAALHDLSRLHDRFADLWTREAITGLEAARDETPPNFETERAALSALANAARLGYAERRAGEASSELARCESSSAVEWGGARAGLDEVTGLMAAEADAARRRELYARWIDALSACDDLRAARLEALREAARELDFEDFGALHSEATRADAQRVAADAELLLARTSRAYATHLSGWAALDLPPAHGRAPCRADALFLSRLSRLDEFFPARAARATFEAAMSDLGIRAGRRNEPSIEESARAGEGRALCFGVSPPDDVRLVFAPRAGADFHRRFFQEAARARQLAWASADLAARYPEFVRAEDGSTAAGFGSLFRMLFTDAEWVARRANVAANVAREIAAACALVELHDARRACALAVAAQELYRSPDARSEVLAETYATRQQEATGFSARAAEHLFDALGEGRRAAEDLRARLFAASLAEYLKTRHGSRWWASRAVGDELIDVWGTASRYTVEELAPLLGAPPLDAELLSESLTAALGGGGEGAR